ncbi:TonB-dependent receptor [Sphingobacterium kyonggiense]|uniref:TonB-dependent receptor n=1 Tax=Sphingobacterium kyonggiense TaxID=714075 RepID=UPI0031CFBEDD
MSLTVKSVPITIALRELQSASGLLINYDGNIFSAQTKVSLDVQNHTTETILKQLLASSNVGFKTAGSNTVVLYKLPTPANLGRIIGSVVDGSGEPLVGASVLVQGVGRSAMTDNKGNFNIELKAGTYTIDITYISYESQRITDIKIIDGQSTPLNIAMKASANTISQVIVTSSYKVASISGLLARQKNASEISNGISAEQIAQTPDRNVGESLKRISGVSTINDKFVIVRGIGERYNSATLDGTTLPSTEAQSRSFSFDIIPTAIIDNVVVAKSITPDMNVSFGGGLIQINTKDIPNENFISLGAGTSINGQSIGKDFLSPQRGKYDYLGFDDGRRLFPKDLYIASAISPIEEVVSQSKRFTTDNFTLYKYKTLPSQNYQFTIGRLYNLRGGSVRKFGFVGALNYRNRQDITNIEDTKRGSWYDEFPDKNTGTIYEFNTTWGGLLNLGLQIDQHRFSFRNTLTRVFNSSLTRVIGIDADGDPEGMPDRIRETTIPTFTTLLQNKLTGQHQFHDLKLDWEFARSGTRRDDKDMGILSQSLTSEAINGERLFLYEYSQLVEGRSQPASRHNYSNRETHYSWGASAMYPFIFRNMKSTTKLGYFGLQRNATFRYEIAAMVVDNKTFDQSLRYISIGDRFKPENIGAHGFMYEMDGWDLDNYQGKSQNHSGYLMFDHKYSDKLRLVWGLRADAYKYTEIQNPKSDGSFVTFQLPEEKSIRWMPSANLTYSPINTLNIRLAYGKTVIRPEMLENSQFLRYNPTFEGVFGSSGISSTGITSWDLKGEWFPGLGEILSLGGFYKHFDKPTEIYAQATGTYDWQYTLTNSSLAKVYGLEFDLRKNLGFIYDHFMFRNIAVYGNLTLQKGEVVAYVDIQDQETNEYQRFESKQSRSMYGQSPYLINIGLQYAGDRLGLNFVFNRSGRKTSFVTTTPQETEYEMPRNQLDAQVGYKFFKKNLEMKINAGNILDAVSVFYNNYNSYENNPDAAAGDYINSQRLKDGFSNDFDEGDRVMLRQRFGRTLGATVTYKF